MALLGGIGSGLVGGATVRLLLDDSQFNRGLSEAEAKTKSAGGTIGRFGGAAKAAFAAGAVAVGAFAASSVKAFSESEEVMAQFQNTLDKMPQLAGETTAAFTDQATALQSLTGYQDEAIISADNILARFKLTGEQIRQAIPIVLDYARATGTDVPAAAQNIGKALLGNTRALKTVGIEFTATGDTAADFNSILDLMQGKVGGAAAAFGETLAGKLEIAKAKFNDVQEKVGQQLIPVITSLVDTFSGLVPVLGVVAKALEIALSPLTGLAQISSDIAANDAAFNQWAADIRNGKASLDDYREGLNKVKAMLPGWAAAQLEAVYGMKEMEKYARLDGSELGHLTAAQSAARTEMQHTTSEQQALSDALGRGQTAAEQAAWAAQHLAEENAAAAREARNLYMAQMTLAGGLLGVQGASLSAAQAQQDLKQANADVAKLAADGKKGTQEYRDALMDQDRAALDAVQSQASLVQSVQDYVEANHNSKAATADAVDMIRQFANQAGLTKGQTNELIQETLGLVDTYKRVPQSVKTDVILNGASTAINNIDTIKARIDALHDKEVNIYVYTHYKQDI